MANINNPILLVLSRQLFAILWQSNTTRASSPVVDEAFFKSFLYHGEHTQAALSRFLSRTKSAKYAFF
jgi:hypothetical protein